MLVDPPQPRHADASAELVHHPHVGHPALAAQAGELSPCALLWQHFEQQVHGMDWREQAQQVNAIELGGGMFAMPSAGGSVRPAVVDEIVGDERRQEFEQCRRAGGRKIGIHGPKTTSGNLTRQRQ
jgi:hypothetical protein